MGSHPKSFIFLYPIRRELSFHEFFSAELCYVLSGDAVSPELGLQDPE